MDWNGYIKKYVENFEAFLVPGATQLRGIGPCRWSELPFHDIRRRLGSPSFALIYRICEKNLADFSSRLYSSCWEFIKTGTDKTQSIEILEVALPQYECIIWRTTEGLCQQTWDRQLVLPDTWPVGHPTVIWLDDSPCVPLYKSNILFRENSMKNACLNWFWNESRLLVLHKGNYSSRKISDTVEFGVHASTRNLFLLEFRGLTSQATLPPAV